MRRNEKEITVEELLAREAAEKERLTSEEDRVRKIFERKNTVKLGVKIH